MKKLSLKNLKLEPKDLIERNQLKSVIGGYGGYGGDELWIAKVTCNGGTYAFTSGCRTMEWIDSELPHMCSTSGIQSVYYFGCA